MTDETRRNLVANMDTTHTAPDRTRALVIFNDTTETVDGLALFHADYEIYGDSTVPPIVVHSIAGDSLGAEVRGLTLGTILSTGSRRIQFDLLFTPGPIPPLSWTTVFASYCDPGKGALLYSPCEAAVQGSPVAYCLVVVETKCHAGRVPPIGRYDQHHNLTLLLVH